MKMLHLKPAPGRDCPMPGNPAELLPKEGDTVSNSAYWQRRLQDGDVVAVDPKATKGVKT